MALESGTQLGHYEIAAQIGRGGMGEVYRARDTKLGREVAIKVLPAEFAQDEERLARLEREARMLAALNHPNIAAIHGLEESGDTRFLVLELVEGDTLAGRLRRGAIPVEESLKLGLQIAEALEAAHEKGVIHRDLKPANIKITPEGRVKVLDFGLAKAFVTRVGDSEAPTDADTKAGSIVGTPAYMSPEQSSGEAVDRRTDVWAFGVVFFEMLTGESLFEADHFSQALVQVLTKEIDWTRLPPDLPKPAHYLLERCLDRDLRRRLRDMGEARVLLDAPSATWNLEAAREAPVRPAGRPWTTTVVVSLLSILSASLLTWRLVGPDREVPLVSRTSILLPEGQDFSYGGRRVLEISSDGTHVVYSAPGGIWVRRLADNEPTRVPGAHSDARSPFLSPDGDWIVYWAVGALWRISLQGGRPMHLVDARNPWSASWSLDGTILYGQGTDGIWQVSGDGDGTRQVIDVEEGAMAQGPQLLPDGEWVLYTLRPSGAGSWNEAQIVVESLETHQSITLIDRGRDPRYIPGGHIAYALNNDLWGVAFDAGELQVTGTSQRLIAGVADTSGVSGAAQFDVSDNGSLVYVPQSTVTEEFELTWVSRDGTEDRTPFEVRGYRHPRVSPDDDSSIVVAVKESNETDVLVGDVRRGTLLPVVSEPGMDAYPIFHPDGVHVVFFSARSGGGLFQRRADGTGPIDLLVSGPDWRVTSWTPDGRMVYEELEGAQVRIGAPEAGAETSVLDLVDGRYYDEMQPVLSPDGRWLAYQSTESGALQIIVDSFPQMDNKHVVSTEGGASPVWSRDGSELYYLDTPGVEDRGRLSRLPLGRMMAVTIDGTEGFASSTPKELFRLRDYVFPDLLGRQYDVDSNGRFLMIRNATPGVERANPSITIVQYWIQELQERVPVD